MHKLGRGHRDKLQQFMAITGASEKVALQTLKSSDWHLKGAFDVFYSQSHIRSYTDTKHLEELYTRYKYPYTDMILVDGITLLCNDLQVDPQDILLLLEGMLCGMTYFPTSILGEKGERISPNGLSSPNCRNQSSTNGPSAPTLHIRSSPGVNMCEFSKQEFTSGLQALGIDALEKFRERIQYMRSELNDEQKFRDVYNFALGWAKEKGQKSLALDTAIGLWQPLFSEKQWPLVNEWCQFLQARHNKAISRDTWSQLLEFARIRPKVCILAH